MLHASQGSRLWTRTALVSLVLLVAWAVPNGVAAAQSPAPPQVCADSTGAPSPPSTSRMAAASKSTSRLVPGRVFLDGRTPLAHARVRVMDRGRVLAVTRTARTGAFLVRLPALRSRFLLVATGGRVGGRPFRGELRSRLRGYLPASITYVDPATTVLDELLRRHPSVRIASAAALVKRMLRIPQWRGLGYDLGLSDRHLSARRFLAAARRHGGVSRYVAKLAHDAAVGATDDLRGPKRTLAHPIARAVLRESEAGTFSAEWFGNGLADAALSTVGDDFFGWVLSQVGFGDASDAATEQMQTALTDIQSQLDVLSDQVGHVQVTADQALLAGELGSMNAAASAICTVTGEISQIANSAGLAPGNLQELTCQWIGQNGPCRGTEAPATGNLETLATDQEGGYASAETLIANAFLAPGALPPLLNAMSQTVFDEAKVTNGFWRPAESATQRNFVNYWTTFQALLLNAKLEYQHLVRPDACPAVGATPANCAALTAVQACCVAVAPGYASPHALAETALLPPDVPAGTSVDETTGLMWIDWTTIGLPLATFNTQQASIQALNKDTAQNGGFANWEMPSVTQMQGLWADSGGSPQTNAALGATWNAQPYYWTSTLQGNAPIYGPYYWVLDTSDGNTSTSLPVGTDGPHDGTNPCPTDNPEGGAPRYLTCQADLQPVRTPATGEVYWLTSG